MGLFDSILKRNKELTWMYDLDMFEDDTTNAYLKEQHFKPVLNLLLGRCHKLSSKLLKIIKQSRMKVTIN